MKRSFENKIPFSIYNALNPLFRFPKQFLHGKAIIGF